ncbi:MAG: iron ABC transporter substrate-binding protein [Solirubrobacterales bacterium]
MRQQRLSLITSALSITIVTLALAGCGDDGKSAGGASAGGAPTDSLVIYSGREAELVDPLYKKFEEETGIKLDVRYGESPELAATLAEEGDNTRADVFYAQDAGSIGAVEAKGLLAPLPAAVADKVEARYRDGSGKWTGVTGRVRVLVYNTDRITHGDLPPSVLDLTKPEWKGRVAIAPGNGSFESFVTAMREVLDDKKTERWLGDMKANNVQTYEGNSEIVDAVAKGEVDAGLVNHYYLYQLKSERPSAPVANHFFAAGDVGGLVNVSAAGIVAGATNQANAEKFITFLLDQGQRFFATEAEEKEYPLVAGFDGDLPSDLKPLDELDGPDVSLDTLGAGLPETVRMIGDAGFRGT